MQIFLAVMYKLKAGTKRKQVGTKNSVSKEIETAVKLLY
jgi:hypothetical protein